MFSRFTDDRKEDAFLAMLDNEEDIAATRPDYKRRSLAAPQPYLTVTSKQRDKDGAIVITGKGDLDLSTILPFRDAAFSALGQRPPLLVLDMTHLNRLDITGLNTLLTIGRVARLVHVSIRLIPGERIRTLFTITGLERQLPFENEENNSDV